METKFWMVNKIIADGYIATPDGGLAWLSSLPNPDKLEVSNKEY